MRKRLILLRMFCQRPYSIRTRIKTVILIPEYMRVGVRDHIPLEQGLRLQRKKGNSCPDRVRDHIPLEQGLRPMVIVCCDTLPGQRPYSIRTRIKTWSSPVVKRSPPCQRPYSIRTRIKTVSSAPLCSLLSGQRPYSIRTRIKTAEPVLLRLGLLVRDHIPLEQGLRLPVSEVAGHDSCVSETIFH